MSALAAHVPPMRGTRLAVGLLLGLSSLVILGVSVAAASAADVVRAGAVELIDLDAWSLARLAGAAPWLALVAIFQIVVAAGVVAGARWAEGLGLPIIAGVTVVLGLGAVAVVVGHDPVASTDVTRPAGERVDGLGIIVLAVALELLAAARLGRLLGRRRRVDRGATMTPLGSAA